ncbi:hypothetical protein [Flavobacterium silvaticum]|uniref:Transcription elongation factor n=1 Tax=Flavobacterium silvaticum TaxID=1852020 RepID=A0A972JGB1_9FLAO|nr:hypothetical protein [Flavobacterium silvaticum]NMH26670.1 hypothetical protein [Flavobacterium silvaticum]
MLKQKIHARYLQLVNDKIDVFRDMISGLADDAQSDAKGSAGDKHETGLSMMHLEQEKLSFKLRECLEQKAVLDKIDPNSGHSRIGIGSLVKANGILFFVSLALPKIAVDGTTILALSPNSPLGSKLMSQAVGFTFEINGTSYEIQEIN